MVNISEASIIDSEAISNLLKQLDYPNNDKFINNRIKELIEHKDETLLVAKIDEKVVAVLSLHFIPQLALEGDFCRISYFCVDEDNRSYGVGALLESYAVKLAKEKKCDRIEVHCNQRREKAHNFYYKQGYEESPKYLIKSLV
ncbi:GNAT family N-acetyltransferase [Campylobacterota bacterium DY0563]